MQIKRLRDRRGAKERWKMQQYTELKYPLDKNKRTQVEKAKNGIYKIISLNYLPINTSLAE